VAIAAPSTILTVGPPGAAGRRPLLFWVLDEYRIAGEPVSFRDYPYLRGILECTAPVQVFRKAAGTAFTELMMMLGAYTAVELQKTAMHTFPTGVHVSEFVNLRVDPMLQDAPFSRKFGTDAKRQAKAAGGSEAAADTLDNKRNKRFGRGFWVFRGCESRNDLIGTRADVLIIDEYDDSNQVHIPDAVERLNNSKLGWIRKGGHPYLPGGPIDVEFRSGDQTHWFFRCAACNEWQPLDWERNVVREAKSGEWPAYLPRDPRVSREVARAIAGDAGTLAIGNLGDIRPVCGKCGAFIDRLDNRPGHVEWVSAHPERSIRSWQQTQLYVRNTSLAALYREFVLAQASAHRLSTFWRKKLGEPHDTDADGLTQGTLERASVTYDPAAARGEFATAGVDVGKLLHVRISVWRQGTLATAQGAPGVRAATVKRTVRTFREVARLLDAHGVSVCVVDAMPETREAKRFQSARPHGSVVLCTFGQPAKGKEKGDDEWFRHDRDEASLLVDRTILFDEVTATIAAPFPTSIYPRSWMDDRDFVDQMMAPKRVLVDGPNGSQRFAWIEGTAADHFRLADLYDYAAGMILATGHRVSAPLTAEAERGQPEADDDAPKAPPVTPKTVSLDAIQAILSRKRVRESDEPK
jgi:hypothetical protein